jgi:hypothetical protein
VFSCYLRITIGYNINLTRLWVDLVIVFRYLYIVYELRSRNSNGIIQCSPIIDNTLYVYIHLTEQRAFDSVNTFLLLMTRGSICIQVYLKSQAHLRYNPLPDILIYIFLPSDKTEVIVIG